MLIENIPNTVLAFTWFNLPRAEFCCPLELCGVLVSISHLLTLHWGILDAPLGTVLSIVTSLSTLKVCITNRSTWRTRFHWGSHWRVLTRLLVIGVWSLWSGVL
jgi:hypothetical protein